MRVSANPALAELQRLKPAKLRVYTRDSEEPKAVAIPANRKRWERLGTTLEGLDWTRIEALDPRGNITGIVANENDDAPAAAADTELGDVDVATGFEPLLNLMLKSQQMALQQQTAMIKPLIDGQARLVETVTAALGAVAGAYRMALAAASVPAAAAAPADGSDESLGRFLQMAMMFMASKGGGGPQAALGAVKVATDAARRPPKSANSPANGARPPSTEVAQAP